MDKWDRKIIVALTLIASYLFLGTVFFHIVEGWRFVDSFYFTGVTLTTVGYGDFVPTHDIAKIAVVFLAFSGVGIIFYSISIIGQKYFENEEERLQKIWENTRARTSEAQAALNIENIKNKLQDRTKRNAIIASNNEHKERTSKILKR